MLASEFAEVNWRCAVCYVEQKLETGVVSFGDKYLLFARSSIVNVVGLPFHQWSRSYHRPIIVEKANLASGKDRP